MQTCRTLILLMVILLVSSMKRPSPKIGWLSVGTMPVPMRLLTTRRFQQSKMVTICLETSRMMCSKLTSSGSGLPALTGSVVYGTHLTTTLQLLTTGMRTPTCLSGTLVRFLSLLKVLWQRLRICRKKLTSR